MKTTVDITVTHTLYDYEGSSKLEFILKPKDKNPNSLRNIEIEVTIRQIIGEDVRVLGTVPLYVFDRIAALGREIS